MTKEDKDVAWPDYFQPDDLKRIIMVRSDGSYIGPDRRLRYTATHAALWYAGRTNSDFKGAASKLSATTKGVNDHKGGVTFWVSDPLVAVAWAKAWDSITVENAGHIWFSGYSSQKDAFVKETERLLSECALQGWGVERELWSGAKQSPPTWGRAKQMPTSIGWSSAGITWDLPPSEKKPGRPT